MSKETLKAIATELDRNNKTLTTYPGSILTILNPASVIDSNGLEGIDIRIAAVLGNEISNIKDNIIPTMKELGKKVNDIVGKTKDKSLFNNVKIITAEIPEVIEEMINRGMINKDGSKINQLSNTALIIPTPEVSIIRSYLKGGGGQMDALIKSHAATITDNDLIRIWETYLNRITSDNTNYLSLGTKVHNDRFAMDLFVLAVIVKNLIHEVPTGVRATPGTYDGVVMTLNAVIDAKIMSLVNLLKANAAIGKVIYKADGINSIVVIKESYDKFLAEDGEPEVIYGAVLKGLKTASLPTLKEKKDDFLAEWNKYVSNEMVRNKMATLETYRMAYRFALDDIMTNYLSNSLNEQIDDEVKTNYSNLLIEYMNSIPYMDIFEVNEMVEYIIGKIIFRNTNTFKFLTYMKHYSKMNNKLTAKEAATYASIDLIIDYLLTQVKVK